MISDQEAKEMLSLARMIRKDVEEWLRTEHKELFPFKLRATHPHKLGKCRGDIVIYRNRVEFISQAHTSGHVFRRPNLKKIEFKGKKRLIIFHLNKRAFVRFGGSKQMKFVLEESLPEDVLATMLNLAE